MFYNIWRHGGSYATVVQGTNKYKTNEILPEQNKDIFYIKTCINIIWKITKRPKIKKAY